MAEVVITLLTRPNCSLCGPVRRRIEAVAAQTGAGWRELNIDEDPALREQYTDLVPVVLVDGVEHSHWRVDEANLAKAVRKRQRPGLKGLFGR